MSSLRFAGVSLVLILAAACGTDSSTPPDAPSPTPAPAPGPVGARSTIVILTGAEVLGDRAFAPPDLTVPPGATITWANNDAVAHTSTSDAPGWNSGIIAPRGTFTATLDSVGTFSYHCSIHPGMTGRITVR